MSKDYDELAAMEKTNRPKAALDVAYGQFNTVLEELDKSIHVLRDRLSSVSVSLDEPSLSEDREEIADRCSELVSKVRSHTEHVATLVRKVENMTRALEI